MTQVFHYQTFLAENFRSFKTFAIDGLSDINIIGGENGAGKSSLLEAAFHLADRLNPNTLFSDFNWRSIQILPQDLTSAFRQSTYLGNIESPIIFRSKTSIGKYAVEYKFGPQNINPSVVTSIFQPNNQNSASADHAASTNSLAGYSITGYLDTLEDLRILVQLTAQGMQLQIVNNRTVPFNSCMMVNSLTRRPGFDHASRFSDAVRAGKLKILLDFIHLVHMKINNLALLTVGGASLVHADIGHDFWVPLTFLGEGASVLFTIALFMISSENGIIFLDEFDSVVHHSLLDKLWELIITLGHTHNVQVFATTHSQESLDSAVRGAEAAGSLDKLRYYRLRRDKQSQVRSVAYSGESLKNNITESWEVR